MDPRLIARSALVALGAALAVLTSGFLLYGTDRGPAAQYAWTHAIAAVLRPIPLLIGMGVLLLQVRSRWSAFPVSIMVLPVPIFVAIAAEVARSGSSHNLLPFELAYWLFGSLAVHAPVALAKVLRDAFFTRRPSRA